VSQNKIKVKRNVIPTHCNLRDAYLWYLADTTIPSEDKLLYKEYSQLVHKCNKKLTKLCIEESMEITFPYRTGRLRIKKYKPNLFTHDGKFIKERLAVDYQESKRYWEKEYPGLEMEEIFKIPGKTYVYYNNEHTDGYKYKFLWEKYGMVNVPGKSAYRFIPTRTIKRQLATWSKSPERKNDYYS